MLISDVDGNVDPLPSTVNGKYDAARKLFAMSMRFGEAALGIFYKIERRVDPRPRYNFSGRLFILLDGGTGYAADTYVNAAQRIGLATLVGRHTPGSCGPYFLRVMVRLPASGMVFLLEADLMLNRDGTVNEIAGTRPDIECPPGLVPEKATREELLRDQWIKRIMEEH
jgi:C-terminal processing protease CtpA/Prc